MTVRLRPDQEAAVEAVIRNGEFQSADEYVQALLDRALRKEAVARLLREANAYGRPLADAMGIREEDVDRIVHEYRAEARRAR